jgi:UDP-N-acetylglucosamine 2-epimerase (non-hydrolysing)
LTRAATFTGPEDGRRARVLAVVGTRPEAIKMYSVVAALKARDDLFETHVCSSGQHAELLDDALATFGLAVDDDLAVMRHDQQPGEVTWAIARGVGDLCHRIRPDLVVVQGDTTTTTAAALAAFYGGVPVAHVEAGLRTYDKHAPWPEEVNRRVVGVVADLHFAPTELAAANLLREGVPPQCVHVTGNTGIDALRWALAQPRVAPADVGDDRRRVVVTAHRRESIPDGLEAIARAIRRLAGDHPDVLFQFVAHPSPAAAEAVERGLRTPAANLRLVPACGYVPFVQMLGDAHLVVTDSGGLQEEAPALGLPVVVVSERTERTESLVAGGARMVGAREDDIVEAVGGLLEDPSAHARMAVARDLYGDGHAGARIVAVLADALAGTREHALG